MYAKFGMQVVATILAALTTAMFGDNHISVNEAVNVVILGLGAVAVLGAGNLPAGVWRHTKTIVSAATAAAVVLQASLTGGVSPTEWVQIVLAALGAVGVYAVRSAPVLHTAPPVR